MENCFNHIKDSNPGHSKAVAYVGEALDLWGKMELVQVSVDDKSSEDVTDLQTNCDAWLREVYKLLGQEVDGSKFDVSLDADLQTAARDRANFQSQLCRDFAMAINGDPSKIKVCDLDFRYLMCMCSFVHTFCALWSEGRMTHTYADIQEQHSDDDTPAGNLPRRNDPSRGFS